MSKIGTRLLASLNIKGKNKNSLACLRNAGSYFAITYCICVSVCIYVYIYVYICIYMYIYVHIGGRDPRLQPYGSKRPVDSAHSVSGCNGLRAGIRVCACANVCMCVCLCVC